jgi:hypothetical protein
MSPALLSKRLQQLARAGIVERRADGKDVAYLLTPAGHELRPVVEAVGAWGVRWIGELGDEDLDPQLLLWDMHRNIDHSAVPAGRTVVQFRFPDAATKTRHWWLVIMAGDADVCDVDPGYEVAVTVLANLRALVEVWRGDVRWSDALRCGAVQLEGSKAACRSLPSWFTLSVLASVPRPT